MPSGVFKPYAGVSTAVLVFTDKVWFYDIEKQAEIADHLRRITSLIGRQTEQLLLLDQLVKSRFIELFGDPIANPLGWPVKRLDDISVLITNGNTPKGGSDNYVSEGIVFLRSQNVWRNKIDLDDVAYIDAATLADMAKSSLHDKDILITKTGRINTENSSLGRAALFRGADNSANINGHPRPVMAVPAVLPQYLLPGSRPLVPFENNRRIVFADGLIRLSKFSRRRHGRERFASHVVGFEKPFFRTIFRNFSNIFSIAADVWKLHAEAGQTARRSRSDFCIQ